MNSQDALIDAGDLAARWGVSRATALGYTRRDTFPAPVGLSAKTLRWSAAEVAEWEQRTKAEPVRRVTRRTAGRNVQMTKPIVRAKTRRAA